MVIGLLIGRFQPFHNGHLEAIKKISKEVDELIIGIGSSQHKNTFLNPFSLDERVEMIENNLIKTEIDNYTIFPIPDFDNHKEWLKKVKTLVPKFDIVFSGNPLTLKLFKKEGYKIKKIKLLEDINATKIRELIVQDKNWQSLVPEETSKFLKKIKGMERIKKLFEKE